MSNDQTPTVHELKCWPEFFACLLSGEKTFDVRKDDRGFRVGDVLWLREYARGHAHPYTGRDLRRRVSYVLSGWGLEKDYVVLALQPEPTPHAPADDLVAIVRAALAKAAESPYANMQADKAAERARLGAVVEAHYQVNLNSQGWLVQLCDRIEHLEQFLASAGWQRAQDEHNAIVQRLEADVARLTAALTQIADYDKDSGSEGICPYGCDTPAIARKALKRARP